MRAGSRSIFLVLLVFCAASHAQSTAMPLSESDMATSQHVESLTIPSPGEFFAAIGKFDRPAWAQLIRPVVLPSTTSRAQLSLILGTRVADGFIAIEAQDSQQVKNIGKDIINLAKQLGVSESIISRGNSIADFAENNEWSTLKEELEATQNEVKLQMAEQKDRDLIALVTVGAWIRGMQAASEIVLKAYSPDTAKLLRQPGIVDHLVAETSTLPPRLQEEPLVVNVRSGLGTIAELERFGPNDVPSAERVSEIHQGASKLISAILGAAATTPAPTP